MNRSPSLTDAARVKALLRSLNKNGGSQSATTERTPRATPVSTDSRRESDSSARRSHREDTSPPSGNALETRDSEAQAPGILPEGEPTGAPSDNGKVGHPGDERPDLVEEVAEEDATTLAIRELLTISELDLGAGLQSRLVALVGRLVRTLRGVDGFVADESGLSMAGPASCEDAAARSSLAWNFVAGRDEPTVPDTVIFTQGDEPIVHAFLVKSSLGPMTVGVRARHVIPDELISAARAALSAAFPPE